MFRLHPFFYDLGRDFFSTLDSYPKEVANSYGLYFLIASFLGYFRIEFHVFWVLISIILGLSTSFFLNSISKETKTNTLNKAILLIFIFGYIIPWFSFQNYRYGAALLILGSISFIDKNSVIKSAIASTIHSVTLLFLPYFIILKLHLKLKKITYFFIIIIIGSIYFLKEKLINITINLLGYDNYFNDLSLLEERESIIMSLIRLGILFFIGINIQKKENITGFFYLLIIYLSSILLTPFHGRIAPFLLIIIVKNLDNKKSFYKFCFLVYLLIESYFSITRSIFHYGV